VVCLGEARKEPVIDQHKQANELIRKAQMRSNSTSWVEDSLIIAGDVGFDPTTGNHKQRALHSHSSFNNAQNFKISGGIIIAGSVSPSALRDVFSKLNISGGTRFLFSQYLKHNFC